MTNNHFLTRVLLRKDPPMAALTSLFEPKRIEDRVVAGHKVLWTLFADYPDRQRDFLWREESSGQFLVLSAREPNNRIGLFEFETPKPFMPALRAGEQLQFSLRANATKSTSNGKDVRGTRVDVVMNAIHAIAPGARATARTEAVQSSGLTWFAAQGERHGFRPLVNAVEVTGYQVMRLPRDRTTMTLGVMDFTGIIEVTEPGSFIAMLVGGLGRGKAFGCGLMLVRRVSR